MTPAGEPLADLRSWLDENWDPDLTVGEWWERLGESGWAFPHLPTHAFGRGLSRADAALVHRFVVSSGALGAPGGLGPLLAAPTIAEHGNQAQIDRYVRDIVTGRRAWCQLFSEPGAGSDLAGLSTTAELDGDQWRVNGQKVWTSFGQYAELGMLLARTGVGPKHETISWMVIDMAQPGVDMRPLREMTGETMFNEVFLTDAIVEADAVIGDLGRGWPVAQTTLANERAGLGTGAVGSTSAVVPGGRAGFLGDRAGDHVTVGDQPRRRQSSAAERMIALARNVGATSSPTIRQELARLHTSCELARFNSERAKSARNVGKDIPGMGNMAKLAASDLVRARRDLGLQLLGGYGMLHAYTPEDRAHLDAVTEGRAVESVTHIALVAQGPPIYGGTDQIQRNILAERTLGLPREPK